MRCNLLHINMSKCCYMHFKPDVEYDDTCARVCQFANLPMKMIDPGQFLSTAPKLQKSHPPSFWE